MDISERDYFALKCLQALITKKDWGISKVLKREICLDAYQWADIMHYTKLETEKNK